MKPRYSWVEALSMAIELSMRAIEEVRALARMPGPPGKDGFGFDDLEVVYDGERTMTWRFVKGDRTREFPFLLPIVLDRGVYKDTGAYERGDAVTWAGSLWIAQEPTGEKPDSGKGWRLAVKRGRDGKDAPK